MGGKEYKEAGKRAKDQAAIYGVENGAAGHGGMGGGQGT